MSKKQYPSDIVKQAQDVLLAWGQIDSTMLVGKMPLSSLASDITLATDFDARIAKLEKQLVNERNQRDAHNAGMWDKIKRVRNFVKGNYGDDSSQYELVGGTRVSERKAYTRRTPTSS
jgi:hypothetical protein